MSETLFGETMRGLSLTQPWAALVASGHKSVETRSWKTSYRGLVAIHAALKCTKADRAIAETEPFRTALRWWDAWGPWGNPDAQRGHIIAVVDMYECRSTSSADTATMRIVDQQWVKELSDQERAFGDYSAGRYGFFFRNLMRLPRPILCTGALGLWTLPDDVLAEVRAQLP